MCQQPWSQNPPPSVGTKPFIRCASISIQNCIRFAGSCNKSTSNTPKCKFFYPHTACHWSGLEIRIISNRSMNIMFEANRGKSSSKACFITRLKMYAKNYFPKAENTYIKLQTFRFSSSICISDICTVLCMLCIKLQTFSSTLIHVRPRITKLHVHKQIPPQYHTHSCSNTGLFKMTVAVLTTCHTQYTWDSSI
jgi:hypothetical protein